MSNAKVTIPRNVADAVEHLRSEPNPLSNGKIISFAIPDTSRVLIGWATEAIRSIPLDTLLEALVNDYDVEKTPEEIAEEKRIAAHKLVSKRYCDEKWDAACAYSRTWEKYHDGYADGIHFTLRTLGIVINGVYEPKGENV